MHGKFVLLPGKAKAHEFFIIFGEVKVFWLCSVTVHRKQLPVSPMDLEIYSNPSKYPRVIGMSPDPKPDEFVTIFDAQSPPIKVDAYRIDIRSVMNFLELERRMPRVAHP